MFNWRIFVSAALGRIVGSLFVGICIALGFGPTQWAQFLIAGMPYFITPGVARLVFLLLASATLLSLLWNWVLSSQAVVRVMSTIVVCLPFVAGAFYVTAVPQSQRHLSSAEQERLTRSFSEIRTTVPLILIGVASGDEPALYAADWHNVIENAGMQTMGLLASPENNECGVMVGVVDVSHPSDRAQAVIDALARARFNVPVIPLRLRRSQQTLGIDFDIFIAPACR